MEANESIVKDLYSDEQLSAINGKLRKRWLLLAIIAVPMIALFVWSLTARTQWLTSLSAVLLGFFAIFWIDIFCLPQIRHSRLVSNALTGRSHTETKEFARLEPDSVLADGVPCRALIFLGEPDKHGSREQLFYIDQSLPLPSLTPGQTYTIKYSGRTIIGIS